MFFNDHSPPHFHARQAGREAVIRIDTLEVLDGDLPGPGLNRVLEWAKNHREELELLWQKARHGLTLDKIQGLD
jgi:hypothetical protein